MSAVDVGFVEAVTVGVASDTVMQAKVSANLVRETGASVDAARVAEVVPIADYVHVVFVGGKCLFPYVTTVSGSQFVVPVICPCQACG